MEVPSIVHSEMTTDWDGGTTFNRHVKVSTTACIKIIYVGWRDNTRVQVLAVNVADPDSVPGTPHTSLNTDRDDF